MPNRIIKESICTSDTVDGMSWYEECFWHRLIVNCDDYGRFDARLSVLKSRLFPLKERMTLKDVSNALTRLAGIGCVKLYECDGRPYLYLPTWEVHQTIRAKKSKYPAPDGQANASEIICKQMNADVPVIQSESESESIHALSTAREKPVAHERGEYGWVKLTDKQYEKLVADLGEAEAKRAIAYVDESAQKTGNKNGWKDWNLTVRQASREGWGVKPAYQPAGQPTRKGNAGNHSQRKYSADDLKGVGRDLLEDV
jgi:hypothetical protein